MQSSAAHRALAHWVVAVLLVAVSAVGALAAQRNSGVPTMREDFREHAAHIPVSASDVANPFFRLECLGPTADRLELSFHPEVVDDPHYIWNGECGGPVLLGFRFQRRLDLSAEDSHLVLRSKNAGASRLHLAVRQGGRWFTSEQSVGADSDWTEHTLRLATLTWRRLNIQTFAAGRVMRDVPMTRVEGVGFWAPVAPERSRNCIRLDWFELTSSTARLRKRATSNSAVEAMPPRGFLDASARFVRSALVLGGEPENRTRRGILARLGHGLWACFDTDLLRWAVVWRRPSNRFPISADSMAAVSFPDRNAKARRAPRPLGSILWTAVERPGAAVGERNIEDPRAVDPVGGEPFGPLPTSAGRWSGFSIANTGVEVEYRVGRRAVVDRMLAVGGDTIERRLVVAAASDPVVFAIDSAHGRVSGGRVTLEGCKWPFLSVSGAILRSEPDGGTTVVVAPAKTEQVVILRRSRSADGDPRVRRIDPAVAGPWTTSSIDKRIHRRRSGAFRTRSFELPTQDDGRLVRPTDVAFGARGEMYVSAFDGDVWRVEEARGRARWVRIASGLFEPMALEVLPDGALIVLGRDAITELVGSGRDGWVHRFRNRSDAFLQTLHTRDYAMSLCVEPDGSLVVAKGGIYGSDNAEHSTHRGSIVRLQPDGSVEIVADGLRMPFVGRRGDGALFVSDQQGHFVPSSPIFKVTGSTTQFGHLPTRHRGGADIAAPLLYYPYQANRSGAGFVTLSAKGFPDLGDQFVHVSWNGRLFPVSTPKRGLPFSWRLPLQLEFPALQGATNPRTGELFVTGLGISGYQPTTVHKSGLVAIREVGDLVVPAWLEVEPQRIRLGLRSRLASGRRIVVRGIRAWNIKWTKNYGSGHYRWDGKPGEHRFDASELLWTDRRKTLELSTPRLYRSDILVLELTVQGAAGEYPLDLYARPAHLPVVGADFETESERVRLVAGDARLGQTVFANLGCVGCHSLTGAKLVGPPLNRIGVAPREDLKAYLRRSIVEPHAEVTPGYSPVMPSFAGVLSEQELEHLIAYLLSLRDNR